MGKQLLKDVVGWGFLVWLIGYGLGILLFTVVPPTAIGWIIMPIGAAVTIWVLTKKIGSNEFTHYLLLAVGWTVIAVVCDYFFLVKAFKPADGYYKLDVYIYYLATLALPLIVGWGKNKGRKVVEGG